MSSMPAMPVTTVQKMIGAIIILTSLMKPSPSGLSEAPVCGQKMTKQHAQHNGDNHLEVKRTVKRFAGRHRRGLRRAKTRRRANQGARQRPSIAGNRRRYCADLLQYEIRAAPYSGKP